MHPLRNFASLLIGAASASSIWHGEPTLNEIPSGSNLRESRGQAHYESPPLRPSPREFARGRWLPEPIPSKVSSQDASPVYDLWGQSEPWPASSGNPNYGIVMDAGSTGT